MEIRLYVQSERRTEKVVGRRNVAPRVPLLAHVCHLGYPLYFLRIIGVWKVLGVSFSGSRFPRITAACVRW